MSKYTISSFYEKVAPFLKEHNYELNRDDWRYDSKINDYKKHTYKTEKAALNKLIESKTKYITFRIPNGLDDTIDAELNFKLHSNFFRLNVSPCVDIEFHKVSEFISWYERYGDEFNTFYSKYHTIAYNIRQLEKTKSDLYNTFFPSIKKFREEQECRWKFDKENFKMTRILGKLK